MAMFTEKEVQLLERIVTNPTGNVFCITGLPPELAGGALARYSRAPTGFKETILREFLDENGEPSVEKGSELMDRVLNQFGDESVAELAGTWLCLEDVSNLITKIVEDRRIGGSPIEESTRYVLYDKKIDGEWRYIRPTNIIKSDLAKLYVSTMDSLFETYTSMVEPMKDLFKKRLPKDKFTIDVPRGNEKKKVYEHELVSEEEKRAFRNAYNFTIRSAACDIIRCILPAATKANVGIYGNGRFFMNLLNRLWSEDLVEANKLADKIKIELDKVIPTYIFRASRKEYLVEVNHNMRILAEDLFRDVPIQKEQEVALSESRPDFLDIDLISEMLFPYAKHPTRQIRNLVWRELPENKRNEIIKTYFGNRKERRDRPGRALEFGYPIRFDLVGGFAEYRDLQRHRMLTQQRQDLGIELGYSIPEEIKEIGMLNKVQECFGKSEYLYQELKRNGFAVEAQYAALFNHFIRWSMGMNPRELGHLTELRSGKAGHPKYRRMAQNMARLYLAEHPEMEPLLHYVDYSDEGNKIARAESEARTAYKSLVTGVENKEEW